jgi:hypothetical protein
MNAETVIEKMVALLLTRTYEKVVQKIEMWKSHTEDFKRLVGHDYVRSLRRNLPYRDLRTLVGAFSELLPGFNCEAVGILSIDRFAAMATALDVALEASPHALGDGLALRGFYIARKDGLLERPLIYLNTAYHPLMVSSTFCHELAHHICSELLNGGEDTHVRLLCDANHASHLKDPKELAADVMVSIACYAEPVARKIFATPWKWGLVGKTKDMNEAALAEVRGHLKKAYGFDLTELATANQRLQYLSAMIHYAKLRWALLAVHDV